MSYVMPDPRQRNIFLDSCAFDPKESEAGASNEIFRRSENGSIGALTIAHSTLKEVEHPNTPDWVKRECLTMIQSLEVGLTPPERAQQERILDVLAGNCGRDKMRQDAINVFEASKYGAYFITADDRILKKRSELGRICSAVIVKPTEFLDILREYEATDAKSGAARS
ncbi:hypothetical protein [Paraburkholderia sediminicola]|uniref:hypothetical protein n=1 Tax=Paraburkholderia sediminicola TaxID=458836 RepID=UPI0038B9DC3B